MYSSVHGLPIAASLLFSASHVRVSLSIDYIYNNVYRNCLPARLMMYFIEKICIKKSQFGGKYANQ